MDALHKGIEMDLAYRLNSKFTIEGLMSLGDWTWQSKDSVRFMTTTTTLFLTM